jgi:micrococcal nuclease
MRKTFLILLGLLLTLIVLSCRSGPPPTAGANEGLAARRQGTVGQYQGVIVFDSQCSKFSNENDQIVCISNKGQAPVKIGGWLIRNTIGRTYYFPTGTTLDPGKTIRVHTGAGTNSATDVYWNYQFKPVFDTQDQITLVDDSNVDVAKLTTP